MANTERQELNRLRAQRGQTPRQELMALRAARSRPVTVAGDQPTTPTQDALRFAGGVGQESLKGATFGLSEDIQSGIAAGIAKLGLMGDPQGPIRVDNGLNSLRKQARGELREESRQFATENPLTSLAANVAGGLATGSSALNLLSRVGIATKGIKGAAASGLTLGGVTGGGLAEEGERLEGFATGATVGGILSGFGLAGKFIAGKLIPKNAPAKILETALKFRPSIPPAQRAKMTQTALREGVLPTVKGLQQITDTLTTLDLGLTKLINDATKNGTTIPAGRVFSGLKKLRSELGGAKISARADLKAIDRMAKDFAIQLRDLGKSRLTPDELQALKRDAYKRINFDLRQGKASFAKNETAKSIANQAKEAVEGVDPSIKSTNRRMGELIELRDELERTVSRLDNRNLISLDTAAKIGAGAATGTGAGTAVGTGAAILGAPRIKARVAMGLHNIRALSNSIESARGVLPPVLTEALISRSDQITGQLNELLTAE